VRSVTGSVSGNPNATQSAVEPDQSAAVVNVASRRLGDHDADAARKTLNQAGHDQNFDGGTGRAQRRNNHISGHTDQQRRASAVPVGERPGDQLAAGKADQTGGHRELGQRRGRAELGRECGECGEVEVHRDRPEHGQDEQEG
jgi:hypothetical protein